MSALPDFAPYALALYFLLISAISAAVCAFDKYRARRGGRRIRERTLFLLSLAGGAAAMFVTMLAVRHKTRHIKFMLGVPAIAIAQAVLLCVFLRGAA